MVFLVEGLYPTNDPQSSDDEDAPRTEGALRPAALLRAQAAAREERRVAEDQAKARRAAELRAHLKKEDEPLKKSNVMRRRASSYVILTPHGRARMAARAISEEEILRARRVGRITRARDGRDGAARFKVEDDDIVYITDKTLKTVFTTYRLPSAAWKTEGHPLIGREIVRLVEGGPAYAEGKVTGWLSAAESDFLDNKGQSAALFLVEYTAGALEGDQEDLELHEVITCERDRLARKLDAAVAECRAKDSKIAALKAKLREYRAVRNSGHAKDDEKIDLKALSGPALDKALGYLAAQKRALEKAEEEFQREAMRRQRAEDCQFQIGIYELAC